MRSAGPVVPPSIVDRDRIDESRRVDLLEAEICGVAYADARGARHALLACAVPGAWPEQWPTPLIVLPAADPLELAELAAESSPALVDVEVDVDVDEPSLELVPGGAVVMLGRIPAHSPLIRGLAGEVQLGDGRVTVRPDGTLPERPGSLVLSIRPGAFGWPWLVPVRP